MTACTISLSAVTGERLAQEAVGLSYLFQHDDWLEDLRTPQAQDRI